MKSLQDLKLKNAIDKLKFDTVKEKEIFHQELTSLLNADLTHSLVRKNTILELFDLYLLLSADQPALHNAFLLQKKSAEASSTTLLSYFKQLGLNTTSLNLNAGDAEVFLHLSNRELDPKYLQMLIDAQILHFLNLEDTQKLKGFYLLNLETFIEFYSTYKNSLSPIELLWAFEMLAMIYPTMLDTLTVMDLYEFITTIQPVFWERIRASLHEDHEVKIPADRLIEWMMVWKRHATKGEEAIPDHDPYYQQDIETIIKYIPIFIWWNNGMHFRSGDKFFYFGSKAFCHLGSGGSVRDAPIKYPFTRRMAKVFVNLPVDFDPGERNMYLYCYVKSLKAGNLLTNSLQNFIRHPENPDELETELARWHPVIQKLASVEFENLAVAEAHQFLGYIYHCLRDQPGFSVQRRSLRNLINDSNAYHERITRRQEAREAERLRRAELAKMAMLKTEWIPSKKVSPFAHGAFTIEELTNERDLEVEGSVMKHCVGSYANKCKNGKTSIWSLRELRSNKKYSCVTIELFKEEYVVQMSAPFNAKPSKEHKKIILKWAAKEKISFE